MSILEGTWFFPEEKPSQRPKVEPTSVEDQRKYEPERKQEPATQIRQPTAAGWSDYK